eukprot:TRINITY_DN4531_c0_g1_i2.p1 TRINITY_DN4531_c0_g1~~TRINITY_DN4531_c0_g1_i2.p1  ORF type:complete len:770 (-),score=257.37 TRINITY_DN4531_c0_g1_i2:86-2395(-)
MTEETAKNDTASVYFDESEVKEAEIKKDDDSQGKDLENESRSTKRKIENEDGSEAIKSDKKVNHDAKKDVEDAMDEELVLIEERESPEEEEGEKYDVVLCQVCQSGENEDELLLCDQCDDGCHIKCLDPPLDAVPSGEWYCPKCSISREEMERVLVKWDKDTYYPVWVRKWNDDHRSVVIEFEDGEIQTVSKSKIFYDDEDAALTEESTQSEKKSSSKKSKSSKSSSKPKTRSQKKQKKEDTDDKSDGEADDQEESPKQSKKPKKKSQRDERRERREQVRKKKEDSGPSTPSDHDDSDSSSASDADEPEDEPEPMDIVRSPSIIPNRKKVIRPVAPKKVTGPQKRPVPRKRNVPTIPTLVPNQHYTADPDEFQLENSGKTEEKPKESPKVERPVRNPLDQIVINPRPHTGPISKTQQVWRGGLYVEGEYQGNVTAFTVDSTLQPHLIPSKLEWPKTLDLKNAMPMPQLPAEHAVLSLLPEKAGSMDFFIFNLSKNQHVYAINLASKILYILPSSLLPSQKSVLGNRLSLYVVVIAKPMEYQWAPEAVKSVSQLQPRDPSLSSNSGGSIAVPSLSHNPTTFPAPTAPSGPLPSGPFVPGLKFTLIGYQKDKRFNGVVQFLTTQGGAIFKEKITPGDIDLIVINSQFLAKLIEIPNLGQCKLDPKIVFIRGIEYLERCCLEKKHSVPHPQEILFPSGGVIVIATDLLLSVENLVAKVIALLENLKKNTNSIWSIKFHKSTLNAINTFLTSSETARIANATIEQRRSHYTST